MVLLIKMKLLVLFLIYSFTGEVHGFSFVDSLVFNSKVETMTDGINVVTNELLPTSDWSIKYSSVNKGDCTELTASEHIYNNGIKEFIDTNYKAPSSTNCSGLSVDNDPNNLAFWSDLGIVQELSFSDEVLTCGISNQCDINMNTSIQDLFLTVINPTNGENATLAGKASIVLYNFQGFNISSVNGSRGIGGRADLPNYAVSVRYCVKLKDASNQIRTSAYAKNPELSVIKYNWTPIKQGDHGLNGVSVSPNTSKSTIYKGVDSSTRYLLGLKGILNEQ